MNVNIQRGNKSTIRNIMRGQNTTMSSLQITDEPMYFIQGHSSMNTHSTFRLKQRQWLFFRVEPDSYYLSHSKKDIISMIQKKEGVKSLREAIRKPGSSFRRKGQLMRPGQIVQNVAIQYNEKIPKFAMPVVKNNLKTAMQLKTGNTTTLENLIGDDEGLFVISACRKADNSHKNIAKALQNQKNTNNAADQQYMNSIAFTDEILEINIPKDKDGSPYNNGYGTNTAEETRNIEIIKKKIKSNYVAKQKDRLFSLIPTTRSAFESLLKKERKERKKPPKLLEFRNILNLTTKQIKNKFNYNVKQVWTRNLISRLMSINMGTSKLTNKEYKATVARFLVLLNLNASNL